MSEQAARDIVDLASRSDDHFDSEFDDEDASESESEEDEVRTACERLPELARAAVSRVQRIMLRKCSYNVSHNSPKTAL